MSSQKKYKRKYKDSKGKTRYEYADKGPGYLKTLATVAPIFGAKALLGDLPKGSIEQAVMLKLKGGKDSFAKYFKQGLKGRGSGRALGASLGIATAPIFLKGIELAASKNKKDQQRGLAYIGLSTVAYQLPKGTAEGYRFGRSIGDLPSKALQRGGILGATRGVYKLPSSLLLGYSIAAGRKKSKKGGETSLLKKLVIPSLAGAVMGAGSRGGEDVVHQLASGKEKNLIRALKKALPAAGGGAVGGLLGGAIISSVVEGATKALKKEASVAELALAGGWKAAEITGLHTLLAGGLKYRKPGRIMGKFGLGRRFQRYMSDKQSTQLAIGIKEGISGRASMGIRANVGLFATAPALSVHREIGLKLGTRLRSLPEGQREQFLLKAKKYVNANPELKFHPKTGEPTPMFNTFSEGVDKALGTKPLFPKSVAPSLHKAYLAAMYGGRGALGKGLPKAGLKDVSKYERDKIISGTILGGAGIAALTTGVGAAGAGLLMSPLIPHAIIGGAKSALPNIPGISGAVQKQMGGQLKSGLLRGLMPSRKQSKAKKSLYTALAYGITPAVSDSGRLGEAVGAHLRKKYVTPSVSRSAERLIEKLTSPRKKMPKATRKRMLRVSGVGVGAGLLLGNAKKRKGRKKKHKDHEKSLSILSKSRMPL